MSTVKLSEVENGKIFKIGEYEFIKFSETEGKVFAVAKEILFRSQFGKNANFAESEILEKLTKEVLLKIEEAVGSENICEFETDLTALDGVKTYGKMTSKISLPTLDFYRENVEIFDKYKLKSWWWLATPDSAYPHWDSPFILCVSPDGDINGNRCNDDSGVRPSLSFISSISVSCEE